MTAHTTTRTDGRDLPCPRRMRGDGGPGGGKSNREEMEEYALRNAECLRQHGVDVHDPKPGQGLLMDNRDVNPEEFERAQRACERKLGKPPAPDLSPQEEREFRDAMLNYARCMRAEGIDMPDPTFGANGEVRVQVQGRSRSDPESDPVSKAAEAKCRKYPGPPGSKEGSD
jgi:hypothetical protein